MNRIIRRFLVGVAIVWAGCSAAGPITDTVVANSVKWAQADLFRGLSWSDINSVCPGGVCGAGSLNGYDMAGWSWATVEDMNDLFNHYIGFAALGPGPDYYFSADHDFTASEAFFADRWKRTGAYLGPLAAGSNDIALMFVDKQEVSAWFYRRESTVPVPATVWLLGSTLLSVYG